MNTNLAVTIVQADIRWQNIDENLVYFSTLLSQIEKTTDLIVLPEMFTTGFTLETQSMAEKTDSKALAWMKQKAQLYNASIIGSIIFEENKQYFNRLFFVKPDASYQYYDKKHLFRMGDEQLKFTPGNRNILVDSNDWKIRPLICYDLRFPVWARNTDNYDMLVYIANWPHARSEQWITLLRARAMENQCYVVGVNRVGTDGNNWIYSGNSLVINPFGKILNQNMSNGEFVETVELSMDDLNKYRESFPVLLDRDSFTL